MFGRRRSGHIECRLGGEHAVSSARLRLVGARWSEYALTAKLYRDEEARHWTGFDPDGDAFEPPPPGQDPLLLSAELLPFVGFAVGTRRIVTSIALCRRPGGYEVGGVVDPDFRGQGYGREALGAICLLARRHFGMTRLWAGSEKTNIASQRVLASCQFVRAEEPVQHVLANGRVIEGSWWLRRDDDAVRRCDALMWS